MEVLLLNPDEVTAQMGPLMVRELRHRTCKVYKRQLAG